MKRIPKTPIEFDYDLWISEDGKCMGAREGTPGRDYGGRGFWNPGRKVGLQKLKDHPVNLANGKGKEKAIRLPGFLAPD